MSFDLQVTPSTLEVDYENLTDLYRAITDQDWKRAEEVCRRNPVQASTWVVRHHNGDENVNTSEREIMWRFLPIHSACARQPPASFVAALIQAYPDGPRCVDDQGMYALHYACGNQGSHDVIRQLLVNCPSAAQIPDPNGMLPVHYLACWGPRSPAILDMMLIAHRGVVDARDAEGNTPLDLAFEGQYESRDDVIDILQKWQSDSAIIGDRFEADTKEDEKRAETEKRFVELESEMLRLQKEISEKNKIIGKREKEILKKDAPEDERASRNIQDWKSKCAELERKLNEQQKEIEAGIKERKQMKKEFEKRAEKWKPLEIDFARTKELLKESTSERNGLRMTLGDLMEKHDTSQKKSGHLNDRLGSLDSSLAAMMDTQAALEKAIHGRNKSVGRTCKLRKQALEELLDMEERIQNGDGMMIASLRKQARELEAISAVIKAARD